MASRCTVLAGLATATATATATPGGALNTIGSAAAAATTSTTQASNATVGRTAPDATTSGDLRAQGGNGTDTGDESSKGAGNVGRRTRRTSRTRRTLVIGHRGASGYRPEHTLAAYELAARLGADFLEPDLVPTMDGVLVCRHEPEISGTTDVVERPEFTARRRTVLLDGVPVTGWFTEDFTLAELKTLRAKERLPQIRQRNTQWDGKFTVPTFQELLDLRTQLSTELDRELGVYPETKHPTYFRQLGLPLEQRLLDVLRRNGLNTPDAPVFVQSFEVSHLRQLRRLGLRAPIVQLLAASGSPFDSVAAAGPSYADLTTPAGLASIAGYAQGIGPDKNLVIPRRSNGSLGSATPLVADAHDAGLLLHPWTFRTENTFLPTDYLVTQPARPTGPAQPTAYGRAIHEQITFLRAGIDGLFTDQTDVTVFARRHFLLSRTASPS